MKGGRSRTISRYTWGIERAGKGSEVCSEECSNCKEHCSVPHVERSQVYNPRIHRRRAIRLRGWDYARPWWYYVTICTHQRACILGTVEQHRIVLSEFGTIVSEEWQRTPTVRPEVELDEYVIMPNHIHGIIILNDPSMEDAQEQGETVGTHSRTCLQRRPK